MELGKALATDVREAMAAARREPARATEAALQAGGLVSPTAALLSRYLSARL